MVAVRRSPTRLTGAALVLGLGLAMLAPAASASAADHPIAVGGEETINGVRGEWAAEVSSSATQLTLEFPPETDGFYYPELNWYVNGYFGGIDGKVTRYTSNSFTVTLPADFFSTVPPVDAGGGDLYYAFGVHGGGEQSIDLRARLSFVAPSGVTHEIYTLTAENAATELSLSGAGMATWAQHLATPDRVAVAWGDTLTLTAPAGFFVGGPDAWADASLSVQLQPVNTSESVVPPSLTPIVSNGGATIKITLPSTAPGGGADWSTGTRLHVGVFGTEENRGSSHSTTIELSFLPTWRIAGNSRFATSGLIAQEFDEADTVYLASGRNYPDALSAAPAAAHSNGPLLLVDTNSLPNEIATELARLKPQRVVIAGGFGTISQGVEDAVNMLLPDSDVVRFAGVDRYETSRKITEDAWGAGEAPYAFIATGANFPDALTSSAAAAVASFDGPVILVPGADSEIDTATSALLEHLGTVDVSIAGSAASVSQGIADSLSGLGLGVQRLAGPDRYSTGVAINAEMFSNSEYVYIATGLGYADALSGAALAGAHDAPLFVVPGTCIPPAVLDAIDDLGATEIYLFGGPTTLATAVASLTAC